MVTISGTTITITKGDTLEVVIEITTQDGEPYTPDAGDSIRFALKRSYTDSRPLILKEISTDDLTLRLEAEETKQLQISPYVYDIQLTKADGTVDTFIDRAKLFVTEEVE